MRRALWSLLLVSLLAVVAATVVTRARRAPPPASPPVYSYLPGFVLVNRDGREVSLGDLVGKPWVADFIFTSCPGPCPLMTAKMAALGDELPPGVRRVSFTVDPEVDTPAVLDAYARRFGAPEDWLFLTGPRAAIWELARDGFKLGVAPAAAGAPPDQGSVIHSTKFVLVDREGGIRGYYDGLDALDVGRLLGEARAVAGER